MVHVAKNERSTFLTQMCFTLSRARLVKISYQLASFLPRHSSSPSFSSSLIFFSFVSLCNVLFWLFPSNIYLCSLFLQSFCQIHLYVELLKIAAAKEFVVCSISTGLTWRHNWGEMSFRNRLVQPQCPSLSPIWSHPPAPPAPAPAAAASFNLLLLLFSWQTSVMSPCPSLW